MELAIGIVLWAAFAVVALADEEIARQGAMLWVGALAGVLFWGRFVRGRDEHR